MNSTPDAAPGNNKRKVPEVPLSEHHLRARKIFLDAARRGDITYEEADELYLGWLRRRRARVGTGPGYQPVAERIGGWLERQMGLPPAEFGKAWGKWWDEGARAPRGMSPPQLRMLRILRPTTHHTRALSILDAAVQRGLLSHAEAAAVYRVWKDLRRRARRPP